MHSRTTPNTRRRDGQRSLRGFAAQGRLQHFRWSDSILQETRQLDINQSSPNFCRASGSNGDAAKLCVTTRSFDPRLLKENPSWVRFLRCCARPLRDHAREGGKPFAIPATGSGRLFWPVFRGKPNISAALVAMVAANIAMVAANIAMVAANIAMVAANIPMVAANIPMVAANIPKAAANIPMVAATIPKAAATIVTLAVPHPIPIPEVPIKATTMPTAVADKATPAQPLLPACVRRQGNTRRFHDSAHPRLDLRRLFCFNLLIHRNPPFLENIPFTSIPS